MILDAIRRMIFDRAAGLSRIERMKLLNEHNKLRQGVDALPRIQRMKAMMRINEIRALLGAGVPEPVENPLLKALREVVDGVGDGLGIATLLEAIENAIVKLNQAGELTGDAEDLADRAITHWATREAAEA